MRAHSMRNINQILHGDQTRCEEKNWQGWPRHLPWPKFWWHVLTRDLFAVANLLNCAATAFEAIHPFPPKWHWKTTRRNVSIFQRVFEVRCRNKIDAEMSYIVSNLTRPSAVTRLQYSALNRASVSKNVALQSRADNSPMA